MKDPEPLLFHAEIVRRNGKPVGYVRAASYGHTLGGAVGLAMIEAGEPMTPAWLNAGRWEVEIAGKRYPAVASLKPLYDPRDEAHQGVTQLVQIVAMSNDLGYLRTAWRRSRTRPVTTRMRRETTDGGSRGARGRKYRLRRRCRPPVLEAGCDARAAGRWFNRYPVPA